MAQLKIPTSLKQSTLTVGLVRESNPGLLCENSVFDTAVQPVLVPMLTFMLFMLHLSLLRPSFMLNVGYEHRLSLLSVLSVCLVCMCARFIKAYRCGRNGAVPIEVVVSSPSETRPHRT